MVDDKVRENRIRRIAERRGFRLKKSPRRDPGAIDFNGFMLFVRYHAQTCYLGRDRFPFDATLDQVEAYLEQGHTGAASREEVRRPPQVKAKAKKKAKAKACYAASASPASRFRAA